MRVARTMIASAAVVAVDFPCVNGAMILGSYFSHTQHADSVGAFLARSAKHRVATHTRLRVRARLVRVARDSASVESAAAFGY